MLLGKHVSGGKEKKTPLQIIWRQHINSRNPKIRGNVQRMWNDEEGTLYLILYKDLSAVTSFEFVTVEVVT